MAQHQVNACFAPDSAADGPDDLAALQLGANGHFPHGFVKPIAR